MTTASASSCIPRIQRIGALTDPTRRSAEVAKNGRFGVAHDAFDGELRFDEHVPEQETGDGHEKGRDEEGRREDDHSEHLEDDEHPYLDKKLHHLRDASIHCSQSAL